MTPTIRFIDCEQCHGDGTYEAPPGHLRECPQCDGNDVVEIEVPEDLEEKQ